MRSICVLLVLASILILGSFPLNAYADDDDDDDDDRIMMLMDKKHYRSDKFEVFEDLDLVDDGLVDLYIKVEKSKKKDNSFKVKIQVFDECVNGNTHDEASMKLGFATPDVRPIEWLSDSDFIVKNKFFSSKKSLDPNKKIDLVESLDAPPNQVPISGDDLIQKNSDNKKSFEHKSKLKKIDKQPGWKGSFSFTGPPGSYNMWLLFPAGGLLDEICDNVAGFGIDIMIPEVRDDDDDDDDDRDDDD